MLQLQSLSFAYSNRFELSGIDLQLEQGKNLAIIGESGCGKSTLLKLIYGLHDVDKGQIVWKNQVVLGPKFNLIPGMPYMKFLAQDFDLMPYTTVAENVGSFLSNVHKANKNARIATLLETVEMTEFAHEKVKNLSGGQMQRVAIAKVLALEPELLLLDEPFSHIDNFRKNSLRRKLFSYLKEQGISCVFATHDVQDILGFADAVLVLKDGQQIAHASAQDLYNQPPNFYTASLFGEVNAIPSHWLEAEAKTDIRLIYPHQLCIDQAGPLAVEVVNAFFQGTHFLIESRCGDLAIFFTHPDVLANGLQLNLALCNGD
ncbi:MAG: ATP-binding cassette domain-containing protein [Flavobacterium sp.]|nr:ATP-binding cassette domain-containing protein [Flavobacterium sp.]